MHGVVLTLMGLSRVCMVYRLCFGSLSCLYGVPFVYPRGRPYIDGPLSCLYGVPFMVCLFVLPLLGVFHLCMMYSVHIVTV